MGDTLHNWTTILKMKKRTTFLFLITILITQISIAQRGVRIGYIDMDVILENVDEYKKANLLLNKKVEAKRYAALDLMILQLLILTINLHYLDVDL